MRVCDIARDAKSALQFGVLSWRKRKKQATYMQPRFLGGLPRDSVQRACMRLHLQQAADSSSLQLAYGQHSARQFGGQGSSNTLLHPDKFEEHPTKPTPN
eukprot:3681450-Amphidinium_carterae.1